MHRRAAVLAITFFGIYDHEGRVAAHAPFVIAFPASAADVLKREPTVGALEEEHVVLVGDGKCPEATGATGRRMVNRRHGARRWRSAAPLRTSTSGDAQGTRRC
jgi:hypothetical protein